MQPGNPIVGGTVLRIPAIQSPNYSPGVAGWIIRQDGSAEFNNGQFRGVVIIGNPPGVGSQELGLTPTSTPPIPAPLLTFNADYTWYVADIEYINTTDFFFQALVNNTNFNVVEWITGVYRSATGVQIQTLVEGSSANTLNYGTSNYDTNPLLVTWRNAVLTLQSDAPLLVGVNGQTVTAAENGISNAATSNPNSDTTTSSTFVNMAGTGSVTSFNLTKVYGSSLTQVRVDLAADLYVSAQPTSAALGVLINGVDVPVALMNFNLANTHQYFSGFGYATGVPAGTYTVQARWRRPGGTGTVTRDFNDWLAVSAREVSV